MPYALTKAFYEKSRVILVRPLGSSVRLGSVGYFSDGQWLEVATTETMFKIKLSLVPGSSQPNTFNGKSGKRLKFEAKAAGEPSALVGDVAQANARIEITFGSEGAFVMNVKNQRVSTAGNLADLMIAIRYAYRFRETLPEGERWEQKYAVIVGLASAESVTALSSASKNATAIVSADLGTAAPPTLAQLDASMSVSFVEESVDDLWSGPAKGYAFRALKIEPSIFRRWDRADVEYVRPSRRASFEFAPAKRPSRAVWAKTADFHPDAVKVAELAPSGRAAFTMSVRAYGVKSAPGKSRAAAPRKSKASKRMGAEERKR